VLKTVRYSQKKNNKYLQELIFQEWLFHELLPGWNNIRKYVEQETSRHHFSFDSALAQNARVLSPSDVGFHNILKERSSFWQVYVFLYPTNQKLLTGLTKNRRIWILKSVI